MIRVAMGYDHTQRGWLHWLLVAFGGAFAFMALCELGGGDPAAAMLDGEETPVWVPWLLLGMSVLFAFLAACFARLRVRDGGDVLIVEFGPLRLFRRRVRYTEIVAATAARSHLIDGWGVHHIPGRGWTWNLHGFDCVELRLEDGRLRIGTDDPQGLEAFLRTRIPD